MIRRIELRNFMAHEHSSLSLVDGVNVIVGPNNIGKSAVALALKVLARNSSSNFVVQHAKSECSVRVETDEGHVIEWIRRKSPSYIINGEIKDRLGRGGCPPELNDTLRLAPVEFEDKDFEPHFGDQKNPIFLINRPANQVAQFFSTTSDVERLVAMQRLHQRNRSSAQSERMLLDKEHDALSLILTSLNPVPTLDQCLKQCEEDAEKILTQSRAVEQLDAHLAALAATLRELAFATVQSKSLQSLEPVPAQHPTAPLATLIEDSAIEIRRLEQYTEYKVCLEDLTSPPSLHELEPLAVRIDQIAATVVQEQFASEQVATLAAMRVSPEMLPCEPLEQWIAEHETWQQTFDRYRVRREFLSRDLKTPPLPVSTEEVVAMISQWEQAHRAEAFGNCELDILEGLAPPAPTSTAIAPLSSAIDALVRAEEVSREVELAIRELESLQSEWDAIAEDWLKAHPRCPTCDAPLSLASMQRHGRHAEV